MISDEQIEKFRKLYKQYYGKEISKKDAYEQTEKFILLMRTIAKVLSRKKPQNTHNRRDCRNS